MAEIRPGVSAEPIEPADVIASVSDPQSGGLGVFVGTVRATPAVPEAEGKEVVGLEYEAHPTLAEEKLREICNEAREKWQLTAATAVHRTGTCKLGEVTVVVASAAPHRAEALDACRFIIDTIKQTVPIWKREVYADGSAWVGLDSTQTP